MWALEFSARKLTILELRSSDNIASGWVDGRERLKRILPVSNMDRRNNWGCDRRIVVVRGRFSVNNFRFRFNDIMLRKSRLVEDDIRKIPRLLCHDRRIKGDVRDIRSVERNARNLRPAQRGLRNLHSPNCNSRL